MAEGSAAAPVLRFLFDTNVLLDVILSREPHVRTASELLAEVEAGRLHGLVSAVTIPTIHYIVRRARDHQQSLFAVRSLLELCEVAPVTRAVLDDALDLDFNDYEDAIQHEAARHASADGVVTRNVADFGSASLAVFTPEQLLEAVHRR